MDPETRIHHYELTDNWQNVLMSYDFELSNGNEDAVGGIFIIALEVPCSIQSVVVKRKFLFMCIKVQHSMYGIRGNKCLKKLCDIYIFFFQVCCIH